MREREKNKKNIKFKKLRWWWDKLKISFWMVGCTASRINQIECVYYMHHAC